MKSKPDNVVDNPGITPYPTNVGAPAFTIPDVLGKSKERGITASHQLQTKFDQLKKEYFELVQLAEDTELVYNARCNFIPVVGSTYHMYQGDTDVFLSIIEPELWKNRECLGSYKLTSEQVWERIWN